jgi:hypothetical protein
LYVFVDPSSSKNWRQNIYLTKFLCLLAPKSKRKPYFKTSFWPWSQSYDRELQRQRCKNLQRHEWPSAFWKQKYLLLFLKTH